MAKILVAASPQPREVLERVLKNHELVFAENMTEAEQKLNTGPYDQIVCTIVFDESRMFDLLRLAKSHRKWKRIPFVCARIRSQIIDSAIALEGVAIACKALGAVAFLNYAEYKVDPDREMLQDLEHFLYKNGKSNGQSRHPA